MKNKTNNAITSPTFALLITENRIMIKRIKKLTMKGKGKYTPYCCTKKTSNKIKNKTNNAISPPIFAQ
jgi:hypothetical protein